ncbi:MAG: carboxypeptidase-like regulatory domain-containing protein [Bryobacteraceae bacterium]|nr:carboxypeptidase-like regulatory domain-containing protein [Bryobacteraceae bacterium]
MRLYLLSASLLLSAALAFGQTFYGTVVGAVSDSSGSAMPQATVVLINAGRADRRTTQTDADGNYQFVNLAPGQYRVEIEKTGFRRLVRENVLVEVQSTARIDAAMQVGDVSQVLEVTAQTPLLQTENASLGQVVEARKVLEMPLNGRNVFSLVALAPGVVPGGQSSQTPTGANPFAWANFQIGGGQANQSASYIDGAPNNSSYVNHTMLVPTQDAVQEFKVQTNNLGPEFGRLAGGVINLTTKSGTNSFHGSAYEFFRNRSLNANTFFNNRAGVGRPAFSQNQFGLSGGGPVIKDKTFFFGSYEGFRLRQGQSYVFSVPTDLQRGGNFSDFRNAAGNTIPVYDPLTTCGRLGNAACATNAAGAEVISRVPFPNNTIPDSRIDRAARQMTGLWGRANSPGLPNTAVNNFTANASVGGDQNQYNFRVDHNFSERQRAFVRYTYWRNLNLPIDPYNTKTCVDRCTEDMNTNQAVIGDNFTLSPSMFLDLRLSFSRFHYDRFATTAGFDLTQLGWPSALNNQVAVRVQPIPIVTGYNGVFGTNGTGSTIVARNDVYSISPNLTKILGKHTLKFGAEWRRNTHNYYQQNNPSGSFNFDALMTSVNPLAAAGTGNGFASFLLGMGSGGGLTHNNFVAGQMIYRAYYVGDQHQVTSRLTLNYGLRFEQMGPWSERFDRLVVLLPTVANELSGRGGLNFTGRLGLVNSPDSPSRNNAKLGNVFSPRLGLAYRLNNKTVIRTGWGLFFLPNDVAFNSAPNIDISNAYTTPYVGTLDGSITPADRLSNPFPNGIIQAPGRSPNIQRLFYGQGVSAPVFNDPRANTQQWNFDVQRELAGGMALDVAYAGSKGTHLPGPNQALNQLPESFLSQGAALQQQVPNPFFGQVQLGVLAQPNVARAQLQRPYPQYTGFNIVSPMNRNSIYHALQVKLEKRFAKGASILGSYTYSKLISDTDTLTAWLEPGGGLAVQNWYNLRAERSVALYDVPQRAVVSFIYDLPFGKGQKFLNSTNGAVSRVVGGWGVNGVTTFQSGNPLNLTMAVNTTNSQGGGQRPNSTGTTANLTGAAQDRLSRWFDTSAFTPTPAFQFGNVARSLSRVRSHGIANYDFTVFKNTAITERVGLQFRAEIFNLFNRVQFNYPGTAMGNPQFGVVSGQYNNPRLVQLALRLIF